jgi:antitoxin component YwqK of YwqJK toxin-antitoxin module
MKKFRKNILLLLLSFCFTAIQAQDHNQTDAKGRKQGYWVKTNAEGIKIYEGTFKDDKPVGLMKRFHDDGSLKAEMIYRNDGSAYAYLYYETRKIKMAEGKYIGQERDSVWLSFDPNGQLASQDTYLKGVLNGSSIIYHQDGSVSEEYNYKNGKKHGLWKQYYKNGKLMAEATFVEDKMVGEYVKNYLNGREWVRGKYNENGLKEGTWIYGNEDGKIGEMVVFRNGKEEKVVRQNGTFTEYYEFEKPRLIVNYVEGKKHGDYIEYYDNGQWVEKQVDNRNKGGEVETYRALEGQTMKKKASYKNDQLHGVITYFYENGKVERIEEYVDGQLMK